MSILKRPVVLSTLVCIFISILSLYNIIFSYILFGLFLLLIFCFITLKKYKYITVFLFVVLYVFSLNAQFANINKISNIDGQSFSGKFLVIDETTDNGMHNGVLVKNVECSSLPQNSKILIFDYEKHNFKMGDIFTATIKVSAISKYNKYRNSRYGEQIYCTANFKEFENITSTDFFYKTAGDIRRYVRNTILNNFKGDTAGLLLAVTTGDKTLISDEFLDNVKSTGISHVIVVSGMHLAIIMTAILFVIDRIFYNKYIRCFLSVVSVLIICSVCGFTMSVIRAGVMFGLLAVAPVLNRDNDTLSALFTAGTIILIFSPFATLNISLQLSFLSTFSIVWCVPFFEKLLFSRFRLKIKILSAILSVGFSSVLAIVFTLPVIIQVFGYVSIISPITNLIITYPVTIALVVNILALVLNVIPLLNLLSYPLFWVAEFCSDLVVKSVNWLAKLPITVAVLPKSSFWWSVIIVVALVLFSELYLYRKDVIKCQ